MDYADFSALAQRCAPGVAVETLWAIAQAESHANPHAIGINGNTRLLRRPGSPREAAGWSRWLTRHGYNIDLGLMQINAKNLPGFGLTFETVFDPCTNIAAAAGLLTRHYLDAAPTWGAGQGGLMAALRAYNTGKVDHSGAGDRYVARVRTRTRTHNPMKVLMQSAPRNDHALQLTD